MTERRIQLTLYLMKEKPWDFCYVAFVGADRLQHPLWEDIMALEHRATEYFRLLDRGLGLILEQLGPDDSLFVVSDHGFQGAKHFFDINEYLYSKGLLTLGSNSQRSQASRYTTLKHAIRRVGLLSLARKTKRLLKKTGAIQEYLGDVLQPVLTDIDWQRTRAYVPSMSGFLGGYADIFLAHDLDEAIVTDLCEDLKRLRHPRTGQPLIDVIYTTGVFGEGPYAPREPHLLLLPTDGITFRMNLGNTRLWDDANTTRGTHQRDGVLYAFGGGIKQGFKAPNAELYDIVPTILHSMGLPLPYDFDGRVLDELFEERKLFEQASTVAGKGSENGVVRSKLKKLLEA
jgi:predicted AlkP superfamily phosphohydrolase/phosphomutase